MQKIIEARFERSMFVRLANEVLCNMKIMKGLRDRGAPVIGAISILGVEHGHLTMHTEDDLDGDVLVYRWTGDASLLHIPSPDCTPAKPLAPLTNQDDEL